MGNALMTIIPRGLVRRRGRPISAVLPGLLAISLIGGAGLSRGMPAEEPAAASVTTPAGKPPAIVQLPDATLPTAEGGSASLKQLRGEQGTVLVFLSIECPISNGYLPTLNEFTRNYAEQGIRLIALNPNEGQSLKDLAAHHKEYGLMFPVLKDAGGVIAQQLHATHCPEAMLFDARGQRVYRGRIDDRYLQRGKAARDVLTPDLQNAIVELLAGKPITRAATEPVGCPISVNRRAAKKTTAASAAKTSGGDITYSRHIAPLLQKHCQQCHRPNGIGPFSLLNYDQAVYWADDIRTFTANKSMPPWKPVEGHGDFHNKRSLSDRDIATFAAWVEQGCPEGHRDELPPAATFPDGWSLGPPDVILTPSEEYELFASGKDVYRCFVLPTNFDEDRYVTALEVLPGNQRVVHHVIAFLDTTDRSTRLDREDPGPGYSTNAGFPGFFPTGGLGGWAPGNTPHRLPEGMGKVLPKGAKVVMQVHYHPTGKPEKDQTRLGLYFARPPVERVVRVIPVMPFGGPLSGMKLKAGDANAQVKTSLTIPRDVLALSITPHMHLIGKDMQVTATLPDGTKQPLLYIKDWDFNWQEGYQYREPLALPAGTHIDLVAHFDNSAANPHNPNRPPKDVKWGEQTADEMCIAFLDVVPLAPARSAQELRLPTNREIFRDVFRSRLLEKFPSLSTGTSPGAARGASGKKE